MPKKRNTLLKLISGILLLLLYCEYLIYYVVIFQCDWPSLSLPSENTQSKKNYKPVKFMVLADTHLLGFRNGHWFDKLRREWQMYRAFQTAVFLHKPELVFVLGDLTDEGYFCSPDEFDYHAKRFFKLFSTPKETKMYVIAGNHDIGHHYSITQYKNDRFVKAFNATGVQFLTVRGNHFVLINSMALEGDGCFLCRPVEEELNKIGNLLKCYSDTHFCKPNMRRRTYSKPILLQHFPLYRKSDKDCDELDEAPFPLKQQLFKEKWDCLGKYATNQLLKQIKPRLVIAGHTHHGCTMPLPSDDGIEITLPSFSWRNKNNPTFGLIAVTPDQNAFYKCQMPVESTVINMYIFGGTVLISWFILDCLKHVKKQKYKYV